MGLAVSIRRLRRFPQIVSGEDKAFVLKGGSPKIDKQRFGQGGCFEVVDHLSLFVSRKVLKGFEFHDDGTITDKISAVGSIEHNPPVMDRDRMLPLVGNPSQDELPLKRFLINRFKKTMPQFSMNSHRCTDDGIGF